jgi:hypothetical protein
VAAHYLKWIIIFAMGLSFLSFQAFPSFKSIYSTRLKKRVASLSSMSRPNTEQAAPLLQIAMQSIPLAFHNQCESWGHKDGNHEVVQ